MLNIEFKEPTSGWLPVTIRFRDIEEVFYASSIPENPISKLEDALNSAIIGWGGEVWWHLEPAGYYLSLHSDNDKFKVNLEYSINSMAGGREPVFEYKGDFENVVIPIWRSLRKLQSNNWGEFPVSENAMQTLTKRVQQWRQVNK